MNSPENQLQRIMNGKARGPVAMAARVAMAVCESSYAAAVSGRNSLFDRGFRRTVRLARPVISVGNITTGGTGKTPMVRWLVERLHERGVRAAVLMRGYKSHNGISDEQRMLRGMLPGVAIEAGADRSKSAERALAEATVDCFVLDDGFQHRRIARDLDLVLINAAEPFGFGHVLPRGMLREPLSGLRRASAFVITRADQASAEQVEKIEHELRRYNLAAPIFRATHQLTRLRDADGREWDIDELTRRPFFAFAGIGDPMSLERQLREMGAAYLGGEWLADHAAYDEATVKRLKGSAEAIGARAIVTTEKDWTKLAGLAAAREGLPVWRLNVEIQYRDDEGTRVIEQIAQAVAHANHGTH